MLIYETAPLVDKKSAMSKLKIDRHSTTIHCRIKIKGIVEKILLSKSKEYSYR